MEAKKILIIEDDEGINRVYVAKLTREGFNVSTALSGEEGVRKIFAEKPDLVILDLMLPKKDGFEILKEVKADSTVKNIPVIIMSNLGQDEDVKRGMDLGAADYLIKSDYPITKVVEKVKNTLEKK
jgi:DNA-binding response OmpR family regulator